MSIQRVCATCLQWREFPEEIRWRECAECSGIGDGYWDSIDAMNKDFRYTIPTSKYRVTIGPIEFSDAVKRTEEDT